MTWLRVLLTVWLGFSVVAMLAQIDKPRKPLTSGVAIMSTLITVGIIWAVWVL